MIGVLRATFPTGHCFKTAATLEEALCALKMNGRTFSSSPSPIFPLTRVSETARWSKRQALISGTDNIFRHFKNHLELSHKRTIEELNDCTN